MDGIIAAVASRVNLDDDPAACSGTAFRARASHQLALLLNLAYAVFPSANISRQRPCGGMGQSPPSDLPPRAQLSHCEWPSGFWASSPQQKAVLTDTYRCYMQFRLVVESHGGDFEPTNECVVLCSMAVSSGQKLKKHH